MSLTRVPMLATVNTVVAVAMTGLIGLVAGVLRPASGRTYPTRARPDGGIVTRVKITCRQGDARDMLTSISRELIRRSDSCATYNPRIGERETQNGGRNMCTYIIRPQKIRPSDRILKMKLVKKTART